MFHVVLSVSVVELPHLWDPIKDVFTLSRVNTVAVSDPAKPTTVTFQCILNTGRQENIQEDEQMRQDRKSEELKKCTKISEKRPATKSKGWILSGENEKYRPRHKAKIDL